MLVDHLKKLGLSKKEALIYSSLAEQGPARASVLARRVSLPRTSAYSTLENLTERGLISQEQHPSGVVFKASEPEALIRMIDSEEQRLKKQRMIASDIAEFLTPFFERSSESLPKLQVYEGKNNVNNMLFQNLPNWERSMIASDRTLWGYQDHTFVDHYKEWLAHHWKRNKKFALKVQLFSNESVTEKSLKGNVALRQIRSFPTELTFKSTIWICGEYIIFIMSNRTIHIAYQLKNVFFAENQRVIFHYLWSLTKPV